MKVVGLSSFKQYEHRSADFPKIINPQLYSFEGNGCKYIYSPLYNAAAMLSPREYEFLISNKEIPNKRSAPRDLSQLADSFLYIGKREATNTVSELKSYKKLSAEKAKAKVKNLVLILTNMCNLRCTYCFAFGGEPVKLAKFRGFENAKQQNLDVDMALFAISEFKPSSLFIFGWGEPTLAFNNLTRILDQVDTKTVKVHIDTNGVYLNRRSEWVKYFIEKGVFMHISYDGLPYVNDKYRITSTGKGSAAEILSTIQEISKYGSFSDFADIRVTVAKGQEDRIMDSIDHLMSIGVNEAAYSPIEPVGRAMSLAVESPDLQKLARNIAKAVVYARKVGFRITSAILPALNDGVMQEFGCNLISGATITFGPDGSAYSCLDPLTELKIGQIHESDKEYELCIDWAKLGGIAEKRYAGNLKDCESCPVKCGGGCAKRAYDTYHSFEANSDDVNMCNAKRLALFECIKSLFEAEKITATA